MFLQGLPGSVPWGVYSSYLHDVLANEKHFSQDAVGLLAALFLRPPRSSSSSVPARRWETRPPACCAA